MSETSDLPFSEEAHLDYFGALSSGGNHLAPLVPTPHSACRQMLALASTTKGDSVLDIGCGDGRVLVIAAQEFGCKAHGIDLFEDRIKEANDSISAAGVSTSATASVDDALEFKGWAEYSVIIMCLLPKALKGFEPIVSEQLLRGARCVTYLFEFPTLKPSVYDELLKIRVYDSSSITALPK